MLLKPSGLALFVLPLSAFLSVNAFSQSSPVQVVDRQPSAINSSQQHSVIPPVQANQSAGAVQARQNAELIMLIEQLQEEVRFLRGQVEQQGYQMKKMQTSQRDRYRDLDRRILSITQKLNSQPPATAVSPTTLPQAQPEPASPDTTTPVTATPSVVSNGAISTPTPVPQQPVGKSDKDAYKEAFKLVRAKRYAESIQAFDEFVRFYPSSNLVANAIFWTGEVHRAMTPPNQQAAKTAYMKLIELFPQHPKSADAYYKLGLTFNDLGDSAEAKKMMQKTIDLYPNQSAARLASDFLAR